MLKDKSIPEEPERSEQEDTPDVTRYAAPRAGTKARLVLVFFARGGAINRFGAEDELHDHVLPSTVHYLQKRTDITISRKRETVPGYGGKPTRCKRYWLGTEEKEKALRLLNPRRYLSEETLRRIRLELEQV